MKKEEMPDENIQAEKEKIKFMREALKQAKKAASAGEVPIGCVIVQNGKIIARGYNKRTMQKSALAHAEIIAIKKACKAVGDWRLEDCEMYVTLEPCQMCAGAIIQSRIKKIYIGADNPKAGCAGSIIDLFNVPKFNHKVETEKGILKEECSEILSTFFSDMRKGLKHPLKSARLTKKKS